MVFENSNFVYILPILLVPLLIYIFTRKSRKKIQFPSNIILDKIVKKKHIKRKNLYRLLIRLAILLLLILSYSKPVIYLNRKQKKDLIVDVSFSSLKYRDNMRKIINEMKEKNLIDSIYYLDDTFSKKSDSANIPFSNFKSENRDLIPSDKNYYFLSDNSEDLGENIDFISNVKNLPNCSIKKVKVDKNIVLKNEKVKFRIYIDADEDNKGTILKIKYNGQLISDRMIEINDHNVVEYSYLFENKGYKNFEFILQQDSYIYDNKYFKSIYVHETNKKYYINKQNVYLENILSVLNIKKGRFNNSDLYFFIVDNTNIERKITNIMGDGKIFIFPEKENLSFLNLPVSYQNTVRSEESCYFLDNINHNYKLNRFIDMDVHRGEKIAGNKDVNSISKWQNMIMFNFTPVNNATNFIVKPFIYKKFRNWIYTERKNNYFLNNDESFEIRDKYRNIYFNEENINHLIEDNKIQIDKINNNGFVEIHTDNGIIYRSINQSDDEYTTKVSDLSNDSFTDFKESVKIELWRLFLIISVILFLLETYMFIRERGLLNE